MDSRCSPRMQADRKVETWPMFTAVSASSVSSTCLARNSPSSGGGGVNLFTTFGSAFGEILRVNGPDRPNELHGGATWRGATVGRTIVEGIEFDGKSAVTYDFSNNTVDVLLDDFATTSGWGSYSFPPNLKWDNVRVNGDASFYIPEHGNDQDYYNPDETLGYIDGDFYGKQGQEVAGVFEMGNLVGAFGGKRDPN